jgi:hypothetical protein
METLGVNFNDLSLRELKEEISDISRDINAILDYNEGLINYRELKDTCTFEPSELQRLIDAKNNFLAEVKRRNDGF